MDINVCAGDVSVLLTVLALSYVLTKPSRFVLPLSQVMLRWETWN